MDFNEKQIEILRAAEKLFSRQGFDGTSVRDIAQEAGVNVAMINYYFGSKDKLLDAFFEWRVPSFMMDRTLVDGTGSALEKIDRLIDSYIDQMNSNRKLYRVISIESNLKQRVLVSAAFNRLKSHNLSVIEQVINAGEQAGEFKIGENVVLLHAVIVGTFMNFQINQPFFQERLHIATDEAYGHYIQTDFKDFIKKTIKALLTYEI